MNKKLPAFAVCLAASALLLGVTLAIAEDKGGNAKVSAADKPAFCKEQAGKLNLTGADADDYIAKCSASVDDAARAGSTEKLQGKL